jgi:hypothetical protein
MVAPAYRDSAPNPRAIGPSPEDAARAGTNTMAARAATMAEKIQAEHFPEGFESIRFPARKGEVADRIVALWPRRASKEAPSYRAMWRIIDGEHASVLPLVSRMSDEIYAAFGDVNLSPTGQRAKVAKLVERYADLLSTLGPKFVACREAMNKRADELAGVEPYRAAQPWQWHHDIEIGRMVREMEDGPRRTLVIALKLGEHLDMAEALLRVPPSLTGLSENTLAHISAGVIDKKNPGYGITAELEGQALKAAADAINALATLIETSGIEHARARVLMGADVAEARVYSLQSSLTVARDADPAGDDPTIGAPWQGAAAVAATAVGSA